MSEHHAKDHPIASLILLLVICGLVAWGLGVMNGSIALGAWSGALLFALGAYLQLSLGPDEDAGH